MLVGSSTICGRKEFNRYMEEKFCNSWSGIVQLTNFRIFVGQVTYGRLTFTHHNHVSKDIFLGLALVAAFFKA